MNTHLVEKLVSVGTNNPAGLPGGLFCRCSKPAFVIAGCLALVSSNLPAQVAENWTGATAGLWGTNTNWSNSTTPTSSDDLTILGPGNVAGALNINIAAAAAANTVNFTDTSAVTLTNTTSGANQTLTIAGSGGITTGTGAVTIGSSTANQNINVALGQSQTWTIGSGGMTVTNVISGSTYSLSKAGTGTLTLAGANTFSGGLNISSGSVVLNNAAAAGTGTITISGERCPATTQAVASVPIQTT